MARKKKRIKPAIFFQMYDYQVDLSDGVIILRPEVRIVGSFDLDFARLFRAYAWEIFRTVFNRELMPYLPQPDDDSEPMVEVSGNE